MARLTWRVKLIAEADQGVVSETEVGRIERDDLAVPETLGLTLQEAKQMTAAMQSQMVRAQVAAMGNGSDGASTVGGNCSARATMPPHFALCSATLR